MARGKRTCRILKEIRRQIAEANDIEFVTSECKFQGDCLGTCPKCEAEVSYLEEQLERRRMLGKAVLLAGISMNVLTSNAMTAVVPTADYQRVDTTILNDDDRLLGDMTVEKPKTEAAQEEKVYDIVGDVPAQMPSFPGGYDALKKFIDENLRYPHPDFCGEGRVVVTFTVETDGSLTDISVVRSIAKELDEEAVRLVKSMPKWIPGQHVEGKPGRMKYTLPIAFKLM